MGADPELPNKLASGELEDIRPCMACVVCQHNLRPGGQRLCAANLVFGRAGIRDYGDEKKEKGSRRRRPGGHGSGESRSTAGP